MPCAIFFSLINAYASVLNLFLQLGQLCNSRKCRSASYCLLKVRERVYFRWFVTPILSGGSYSHFKCVTLILFSERKRQNLRQNFIETAYKNITIIKSLQYNNRFYHSRFTLKYIFLIEITKRGKYH